VLYHFNVFLYCDIDKERKDIAGEGQSLLFHVCLSKTSVTENGFRVTNFINVLVHIAD